MSLNEILREKREEICAGISRMLSARKEKDECEIKYKKLKDEYESLANKPVGQHKIMKLAQILVYLPKREKELRITEETRVLNLQSDVSRLEETAAEHQKKEAEYQRRVNELLRLLAAALHEKGAKENENENLRRKIAELFGILRVKDQQGEALRVDLDLARQQIEALLAKVDKLAEMLRNKELVFADKMQEVKAIFEEMRGEKEDKQKEVMLLTQKSHDLETRYGELKNALNESSEQNLRLVSENSALNLKQQFSQYMSPEALDGFRALVSLANMILARAKRPPALSASDKQLIKDLFEGRTGELLEEISRLELSAKRYIRELRRVIGEKVVRADTECMWKNNWIGRGSEGKDKGMDRGEESEHADQEIMGIFGTEAPLDSSLIAEKFMDIDCQPKNKEPHSDLVVSKSSDPLPGVCEEFHQLCIGRSPRNHDCVRKNLASN